MDYGIDLSRTHLVRRHGDVLAVYTWVNNERALILMPALRKSGGWFVVPESIAWKYDNPEALALSAVKAAEVMGMDDSTAIWSRIATIIHDGLPDLIRMPSAPPADTGKANGEVALYIDGRIVAGEELPAELTGVVYG